MCALRKVCNNKKRHSISVFARAMNRTSWSFMACVGACTCDRTPNIERTLDWFVHHMGARATKSPCHHI